MKKLIALLMISIFLVQCNLITNPKNDNAIDDINLSKMSFTLDMTDAPDEVVGLIGTLSNSDEEIQFDFVMDENFATALVEELTPGSWNIQVDAFNSDSVIIYSGNTEVNVQAGTITTVNLHLDPVNGSLNIIVTWGSEVPDSALVAFYPFNGNANDESGFENNAQVYGAILTEDRNGNQNRAYYLDGISDYLIIPHSESLNLDALIHDFTISLWVKADSFSSGGRLFQKWDEHLITPYPISFQFVINGCKGVIYSGTPGDNIQIDYNSIWDGQWHNIVYINDSQNKMLFGFIDSKMVDSESNHITNSTSNKIDYYIGKKYDQETYFKGFIDDIRIYKKVLNESEIISLYNE